MAALIIPLGFLTFRGVRTVLKKISTSIKEKKARKLAEQGQEEKELKEKKSKDTESLKSKTSPNPQEKKNRSKSQKVVKTKKHIEVSDEQIDNIESLLCPISQELMTDPVLSPYGHCYQREYIEAWLDKKPLCPLTGQPLRKSQLVPCITLRNLVEELKSSQRIPNPI